MQQRTKSTCKTRIIIIVLCKRKNDSDNLQHCFFDLLETDCMMLGS